MNPAYFTETSEDCALDSERQHTARPTGPSRISRKSKILMLVSIFLILPYYMPGDDQSKYANKSVKDLTKRMYSSKTGKPRDRWLDLTTRRAKCTDIIMLKGSYYRKGGFSYVVRFYMSNTNACVTYYHSINHYDTEFLETLMLEFPTRFFAWVEPSPVSILYGVGNRNIQRYLIAKNFEMIRRYLSNATWILQIRTDQLIRLPDATQALADQVLTSPISDSRGAGLQKMRLLTTARLSFGTETGWCHIDDHFMFGYIDDMELYWVRVCFMMC